MDFSDKIGYILWEYTNVIFNFNDTRFHTLFFIRIWIILLFICSYFGKLIPKVYSYNSIQHLESQQVFEM